LKARDFTGFPSGAKKNGELATLEMLRRRFWTKCLVCGLVIRSATSNKCSNPACDNFAGKHKALAVLAELSRTMEDLRWAGMEDVANGLYLSIEPEIGAGAEATPALTAVIPGAIQPEPRLNPGREGVKGKTPTRSEADQHQQYSRNTLQLSAPERTSEESRVASLQLEDE